MIHMVQLKPKQATEKEGELEPAEVTMQNLVDTLAKRGMPATSILKLDKLFRQGKAVDGADLYPELANIVFTPFTITEEQHKLRNTGVK